MVCQHILVSPALATDLQLKVNLFKMDFDLLTDMIKSGKKLQRVLARADHLKKMSIILAVMSSTLQSSLSVSTFKLIHQVYARISSMD